MISTNSMTRPPLHLWLMIAALYFTQGMPLGLAMEALPALLRRQSAPLSSLAFLPLVGLPWVLKFLWASRIDNIYSARIGRRRSWILPMQLIVLMCLACSAAFGLTAGSAPWIIALAALASLASATQDIATDGLTAEHFSGAALARANALQIGGTMMGFFFGGSGCLILIDRVGQTAALAILAAVVAISLLLALLWREPVIVRGLATISKASLRHFTARPGALRLLALALLSALTAVAGYGLSKLLLIDAGWSLEQVGRVGMIGGMVTVFLGCGGGAWLAARIGVHRLFVCGIAVSAVAAALWMYLAGLQAPLPVALVWVATVCGCFGAGSASVAIMTLAMRFASRSGQAGTDMTMVQSTRDFGEVMTSSSLTSLAVHVGYRGSFLLGCGFALITLMTAWSARKRLASDAVGVTE